MTFDSLASTHSPVLTVLKSYVAQEAYDKGKTKTLFDAKDAFIKTGHVKV